MSDRYRARYVDVDVELTPPAEGDTFSEQIVTMTLPGSKEKVYITRPVFDEWYIPVLTTTADIAEQVS